MSLTKRHFEEFADELAICRPETCTPFSYRQWERDCIAVADVLQKFNPRFNREAFVTACEHRSEADIVRRRAENQPHPRLPKGSTITKT